MLPVGLPDTHLYYAPICHEAVRKVLEKFGTNEGYFLVRQSRSHENSFVLSLCHDRRVLNFRSVWNCDCVLGDDGSVLCFRIVQSGNGSVSLSNPLQGEGEEEEADVGWTAESLVALLETHKTSKVCS